MMGAQPSMATAGTPGTAVNNSAAAKAAAAPSAAAPARSRMKAAVRKGLLLAALVVAGGLAFVAWKLLQPPKLPPGFASANGRIEATEIDIATKLPERIQDELVDEGDFVNAGQVVAHMKTDVLEAQFRQAEAKRGVSESAVEAARNVMAQRESEKAANEAVVLQRQAELDLANREYVRVERLVETGGAASGEELDTRRSHLYAAKAAVNTAKANVAASGAAIATAKAAVIAAESLVADAKATIDRVKADIDDSTLKSPREGRVQYRITQPGEVLPAGGKVLNLVDLTDVYMTFFLPDAEAGQVKMGSDVRLVLDAYPTLVIPAKVTFVADVAQFTPKTVETAVERQKLTFRIKAHLPGELLKKYIRDVKTGLPGVAYVQLDPQAPWPARLEVKLPQ
jgi:HlyD family secretion protein